MRKASVHGTFTHETAEDAFTTVLSDAVQHQIEFSLDRRGLPRQPMTAFGRLLPFAKGSEWTHSALLRSPMGASPLFTTKQQSIFLQALRNCPRKNCLHRPNQKHRPHTIPLNRNTPAITFNLNGIVQQPPTNPVNRSATRART